MLEEKTSELTYMQRLVLWATSEAHTKQEIVKLVSASEGAVINNLRSLMARGLVSIVGDVPTTGRRAPLYKAKVKHAKPARHDGGKDKKPAKTRAIISAAIKGSPMNAREIASYTGLRKEQVYGCISHWREGKCSDYFRIVSWKYEEGQGVGYMPVYGLGPGRDAPKPKVDRKDRDARWRERNRAVIRARDAKRRGKNASPFGQLFVIAGVGQIIAKQEKMKEAA